MEKKELARLLERRLGELPPKYREPIVLHYFEDMDYKEIAEILEVPMGTVGVRIRRGKAFLKRAMERSDGYHE